MSEKFSLVGWTIRTLKGKDSCIADDLGRVGWYALAEDHRGDHYPYPKLPRWARFLFGCKLALEGSQDKSRFPKPKKRRGINWFFECPVCCEKSFYTYRATFCGRCGAMTEADGTVHRPPMRLEDLPF